MNENSHQNSNPAPAGEEQELCTQCTTGNPAGASSCRQCGARLGSRASADPVATMLVEGHHFGRIAEQPQWLVVVIGIWVVFGLMATVGATVLGISWNMGDRLGVLTGIGLLLFSVVLIAKTTRNYLKQRASKGEDKDR